MARNVINTTNRILTEFPLVVDDGKYRFIHPRRQQYVKNMVESLPDCVEQFWVFGSALREDHSTQSDLDVFVVTKNEISLVEWGELRKAAYKTGKYGNACESIDLLSDTVQDFEEYKQEWGFIEFCVWNTGYKVFDRSSCSE